MTHEKKALLLGGVIVGSGADVARALDYYGRGPIRIWFEHQGQVYQVDI